MADIKECSASQLVKVYSQYLFRIQNTDGGWGIEEGASSSPLNTAEVLLSIKDEFSRNTPQIMNAIKFLRETQEKCGGWPSRRQFPQEKVTVTSTSFCIQALYAYGLTKKDKKIINKAVGWLLSAKENGLWSNAPGSSLSITSTALALQAFAISKEFIDSEAGRCLNSVVDKLLSLQNADGGFPITIAGVSTAAASLQVLHSLLLLLDNGIAVPYDPIDRLRCFIECSDPSIIVQTEVQKNEVGKWVFQFEHFNAAWLLIICGSHRIFNRSLFRASLDYLAKVMCENGCPATPNGRIYTWSTAHCIRALLSTFYHVPITNLIGGFHLMDMIINNQKIVIPDTYKHLQQNIRRLLKDNPKYDKNVFIMIRYRDKNEYFLEIEETLRKVLNRHGFMALFAKDKAYCDSLFENIVVYMLGCKYGIVIFEEIIERHFNPNVSLECGFMLALGKQVLLLKDADMPRIPTDIVGRLYKDFDTRKYVAKTLTVAIEQWLNDLY